MIHTATQIKAKVRNLSGGDSKKAQTLIRNYVMERFLERMSVSKYKDKFILKGGFLVASLVGLDTRATMDIDTTVQALPLNESAARQVVEDILSIQIEDGFHFEIKSESRIMDEADYQGIRFMLEAVVDRMRQPLKIDISTGDVITPGAVRYSYKLMLENRTIPIWTYNTETLLAEKIETILSRSTANTRMRDFYDIAVIDEYVPYSLDNLKMAWEKTSKKRGTSALGSSYREILQDILESNVMESQWVNYAIQSYFIGHMSWEEVCTAVKKFADRLFENE